MWKSLQEMLVPFLQMAFPNDKITLALAGSFPPMVAPWFKEGRFGASSLRED